MELNHEFVFELNGQNAAEIKSALLKTLDVEDHEVYVNNHQTELALPIDIHNEEDLEECHDLAEKLNLKGGVQSARDLGTKKWEYHMIRNENGYIDIHWNKKVLRFDEAVKKAVKDKKLDLDKGTNIRLFQLDTGKSKHPRLTSYPRYDKNNLAKGFVKGEKGNPKDTYKGGLQDSGHSTSVGFTIIGTKGKSEELDPNSRHKKIFFQDLGEGVFPFVDFVPLRVNKSVILKGRSVRAMYDAVKYAVENGGHVITMSMAGEGVSKYYAKASALAYNAGVIFVCAAGNLVDGITGVMKPASSPLTIGVAGVTTKRRGAEFDLIPLPIGNDGPNIDVSAPARWIYCAGSDVKGDYYRLGIGTSQSTAQVAAAAALWRHYYKEELKRSQFFNGYKSEIVEAFRWALKQSLHIPEYWNARARRECKGIMDVEKLLDFSPNMYYKSTGR